MQGRVDAEESVSLASEMPGTITKINVKPGDAVSKGQVLAETDARALQQSISDLQTNTEFVNQLFDKQKALWINQAVEHKFKKQMLNILRDSPFDSKLLVEFSNQIVLEDIVSPIKFSELCPNWNLNE